MNVNLPKWVTASVAVNLKAVVDTLTGVEFFVGGVDREEPDQFQKDSIVLRINGPWVRYGSGITRYKFEVMALITDIQTNSENGYQLMNWAGTIANTLSGPIPVYEYPDASAQVGCLDIDRDTDDFLRIVPFGKIEKDTEIHQAAVIARYEICLDS